MQLIGIRNIAIGAGSSIGDNVWLNICERDQQLRMRIGRVVLIGRGSMISTGGYLEMGDYCLTGPGVFVGDADHVFEDIYQPVLQQGATLGRSVVIEENCWLGKNAVVSGHLTVGRGSVIGANSVVTRDIPPFSVVAGNPGVIVKMYNPVSATWERTVGAGDIERQMRIREQAPVPDRSTYQALLTQNAKISAIDPLVAGGGRCI